MSKATSWRCPFCGQVATIRDYDVHSEKSTLTIKNSVGRVTLYYHFVVCPNEGCNRFTLSVSLWKSRQEINGVETPFGATPLMSWKLIPPSDAKVLPDYVPKPIVYDYIEACAIKGLSPKASATLARRCLQGMVRDFWKIVKSNLFDEIKALEENVDAETWKAIDTVRGMGNIGAHMEKDINVIVEVDPEEAGILISLIETLVDDWYVTRHDREERVKKVIALGEAKQAQKKPSPPQA